MSRPKGSKNQQAIATPDTVQFSVEERIKFIAGLIDETEMNVAWIIRAGELSKFRFRVGQVHMRWTTVLEERNHRSGLRLKLRRAGFQIGHRLRLDRRRHRSSKVSATPLRTVSTSQRF